MKIVTLTLNPALDKSTSVHRMVPEQKLRCTAMQTDAGGGGINVSKAVQKLGGTSTAVFPAGGHNGERLQALLRTDGIGVEAVPMAAETRENVSVSETSTNLQYRFTLPGETLSAHEADACLDRIRQLRPDLLVASGSLPPGLPETFYERVAGLARELNARCIVDTSGPALIAAANAGVYLLKPNLGELSALAGVETLEMNQVDDAALEIIGRGMCDVVVVSLGPQGALLVTRNGFEHIPAPTVPKKSTVGAGDSMVGAMTWALAQGKSLAETVKLGVACGTAATMNAGTRLFDPEDAFRLLTWINTYGERYAFKDF